MLQYFIISNVVQFEVPRIFVGLDDFRWVYYACAIHKINWAISTMEYISFGVPQGSN